MQLKYEKLVSELSNGKVALAYFIYGDEEYLIEDITKKIIAVAVEKGSEDFNLDILYGDEVDGGKIVSIAMSFPMMAVRRAVVVKDIHKLSPQSQGLIVKYVERPSETTCLIMTAPRVDMRKKHYSTLKKNCVSFEAKPLYENQIPDWIRKYVSSMGLSISDEAIRFLQLSAGTSLRSIVGEIEKVVLNINGRKTISGEDVETVVGISKKYNIFELCDSVGRKEIANSIHIMNRMLRFGESPTTMVAMLTRHFTILGKLKKLILMRQPREKMAAAVGVHPFFVNGYLQQAQKFSKVELESVFNYLLDADIKLKSSSQDPTMVMEVLIFSLLSVN